MNQREINQSGLMYFMEGLVTSRGFTLITHIFYKKHIEIYSFYLSAYSNSSKLNLKPRFIKNKRCLKAGYTAIKSSVQVGLSRTTHKTAYQFSGVSTTWDHLPLMKLLPNHRPTPQGNAFKINYFHHCKYYYLAELGHI